MAKSGVKIDEEVTKIYNDIKMEKKHSYGIFSIEDKKVIKVETTGSPYPGGKNDIVEEDTCKEHFEELKELVKKRAKPAFIVFDARAGINKQKVMFIFWCPDDRCGIQDKMLYASSKDGLIKKFEGVGIKIEAHDIDDLNFDELKKEVLK